MKNGFIYAFSKLTIISFWKIKKVDEWIWISSEEFISKQVLFQKYIGFVTLFLGFHSNFLSSSARVMELKDEGPCYIVLHFPCNGKQNPLKNMIVYISEATSDIKQKYKWDEAIQNAHILIVVTSQKRLGLMRFLIRGRWCGMCMLLCVLAGLSPGKYLTQRVYPE